MKPRGPGKRFSRYGRSLGWFWRTALGAELEYPW